MFVAGVYSIKSVGIDPYAIISKCIIRFPKSTRASISNFQLDTAIIDTHVYDACVKMEA